MKKYILNRVFSMVLILLSIVIITFFISRVLPGDPVSLWVGDHPTEDQITIGRQELGLDKPIFSQFITYSKNILKGDMGLSIRTRQPVLLELKKRFIATFELVTISIVFSILIGYPLGLYAGINKGSFSDKLISGFGYLGLSFPVFWLGMILQIIFFSKLNILPLQGRISSFYEIQHGITGIILIDSLLNYNWTLFLDAFKHIILPASTLSFSIIGIVIRTTRSSLIDTMSEPHFETYLTYGFSKYEIVFKSAYKNTLIPISTIVGLSYGLLLGGSFLVETIFDWPGIGHFCVLSILTNDYPAIIGVTFIYASAYIIINFLIDIIYIIVDPRIRI